MQHCVVTYFTACQPEGSQGDEFTPHWLKFLHETENPHSYANILDNVEDSQGITLITTILSYLIANHSHLFIVLSAKQNEDLQRITKTPVQNTGLSMMILRGRRSLDGNLIMNLHFNGMLCRLYLYDPIHCDNLHFYNMFIRGRCLHIHAVINENIGVCKHIAMIGKLEEFCSGYIQMLCGDVHMEKMLDHPRAISLDGRTGYADPKKFIHGYAYAFLDGRGYDMHMPSGLISRFSDGKTYYRGTWI